MKQYKAKTDWKNRVSIHILTRQRNGYLSTLLSSLIEQTFTNWDLYILDNNDSPYNIDRDPLIMTILRRINFEKHKVTIVRPISNDFKRNIGKSRNKLIEVDENRYAVRIDDDSILDRNYLKELWYVMSGNYHTDRELPVPKIGAVGGIVPSYMSPKMYKYPPKLFNRVVKDKVPRRYVELSKKHPDVKGFKGDEEYWNIGEPLDDGAYFFHPPSIIRSSHLRSSFMFDNEVMKKAGMHPSSDDTGFREETITSFRILDAGYKLFTNTEAIAWHLWSPNLGREGDPNEHEKKILKNEHKFQTEQRELMGKLFGGKE